jgi:regulatory protein
MPFRRRRTSKIYDESSLYDYAVGALSRKMRTIAELKRLMRERVRTQENGAQLIEAIVQRLKQQGYLNDTQYAASYSQFRQDNEKFGRLRVVQDLKIKGVHKDVIEKAVGLAYSNVDEENLAREFLKRKRIKKPANSTEAARVFRMLVRAGYGSRIIVKILRAWDVEEETLTRLEQEREEAETSGTVETDE